jgi:hypothetical protein
MPFVRNLRGSTKNPIRIGAVVAMYAVVKRHNTIRAVAHALLRRSSGLSGAAAGRTDIWSRDSDGGVCCLAVPFDRDALVRVTDYSRLRLINTVAFERSRGQTLRVS